MTEHIDRYYDDEEELRGDTPQVDDLEAVEEDEQLGDATRPGGTETNNSKRLCLRRAARPLAKLKSIFCSPSRVSESAQQMSTTQHFQGVGSRTIVAAKSRGGWNARSHRSLLGRRG